MPVYLKVEQIEIVLQRQGVSHTLNGRFGTCNCEDKRPWFIEIFNGDSPAVPSNRQRNFAEVNYPGCPRCFGARSSQVYLRVGDQAGILQAIRHLYPDATFADGVLAYMCYDAATLQAYPHVAADYYRVACYYDVATQEVRSTTEPATVLLRFGAERDVMIPFATQLPPGVGDILTKVLEQYGQPVNWPRRKVGHPDGATQARTYVAWLISEYLQDELGYPTVRRERMIEPVAPSGT